MFNEREPRQQNSRQSTIYQNLDKSQSNFSAVDYENQFYYNSEKEAASQSVNAESQSTQKQEYYVKDLYDDKGVVGYNEDSRPSITTMNSLNAAKNEEDSDENVRFALTVRGKTLIAVYAIAVAVLFAVIILNTTILRSMNNRVDSLQEEIEVMTTENEMLANELEFVQSEEEVMRKAEAMGMIR